MLKRYFATAALLFCNVVAAQPDELTFGLVISIDRELHAYFNRPDVPPGAELRVVGSGERLSLLDRAELTSRTALVLIGSNSAFPYRVQGEIESFFAVVLLVESAASVPSDSNLRASSCASSEGAHHSVWIAGSEGELAE